jgi:uncharacterized protein (TIGR02996 family)
MSATLLQDIKRTPGDDTPRRAYADLLAKDNHPRGRWMHAQLDAADARRPLQEREAAARLADESFHEALSASDQRAREDFLRGRQGTWYPRRSPGLPLGACTMRLVACSASSSWWVETVYDLRYARGMLDGVEVLRGVLDDVPWVTSVMLRAPVDSFGCPGHLLAAYASAGALAGVSSLRVSGPVDGEALAAARRAAPGLRAVDLTLASLDAPQDLARSALEHLAVSWPDGFSEDTPSSPGSMIEGPRNIRALAPSGDGFLVASAQGLTRWSAEPFAPLHAPRALSFLPTLGTSQIRDGGVFACASYHPDRAETYSLAVGSTPDLASMLHGHAQAPVEAIAPSEDGSSVAFWEDGPTLVLLRNNREVFRKRTPGCVYHGLLFLPVDLGLLAACADRVDRFSLDGAPLPAPAFDARRGVCAVPGLAAPVYWPRSDHGKSRPILVADPATAAQIHDLPDGQVQGYCAARSIVALAEPSGVTLYHLPSGRALASLPWRVEEVWIHHASPTVVGRLRSALVSARLDGLPSP